MEELRQVEMVRALVSLRIPKPRNLGLLRLCAEAKHAVRLLASTIEHKRSMM